MADFRMNDQEAEQARKVYAHVIEAAKAADLDSDGTVTREEIDTRIAASLESYIAEGKVGDGAMSAEQAKTAMRFSVNKLCHAVTALRLISIGDEDGLKKISREDIDIMRETLARFPDLKEKAKGLPVMDADWLGKN